MGTLRRFPMNSIALAFLPLAVAINIAGGQLIKMLRLPIYLDSIGTVLGGALFGPWVGLLTGLLTNVIWALSGLDTYALWFAPVAGAIGLLAGLAGRAGLFLRPSPQWLSALVGGLFVFALALFVLMFVYATPRPDGSLSFQSAQNLLSDGAPQLALGLAFLSGLALGVFMLRGAGYAGLAGLLTGLVAAVLSAPIAAQVFGGVSGAGTDIVVAFFRATGANILQSTFAQGAVSDPFDKLTSFMLVWLIIQGLPQRLLARFPTTREAAGAAAHQEG